MNKQTTGILTLTAMNPPETDSLQIIDISIADLHPKLFLEQYMRTIYKGIGICLIKNVRKDSSYALFHTAIK